MPLLFLAVMYAVASFTSARRITSDRSGRCAVLPVAAGVIPVLGLVLASGVVPLNLPPGVRAGASPGAGSDAQPSVWSPCRAHWWGVLLGGGTPIDAGAAQVLVLVGLLAAESIAVVVTGELVARGPWAAQPRGPRPR